MFLITIGHRTQSLHGEGNTYLKEGKGCEGKKRQLALANATKYYMSQTLGHTMYGTPLYLTHDPQSGTRLTKW